MIFWTKFVQKGCFPSKMEKVNITIEFCISELVLVPNFSLKWQFWYSEPNLPKKGIYGWKLKHVPMVVTYYIKLFHVGGRQTQQYFNVSSPCSRRDNKSKRKRNFILYHLLVKSKPHERIIYHTKTSIPIMMTTCFS